MKREHSSKQSQCEKGLIQRGRQRLPFIYVWDGKITKDVAEGKEKADVGEHQFPPGSATVQSIQWETCNCIFHCSEDRPLLHLHQMVKVDVTWSPLTLWITIQTPGRCPWFIFISLITPEELFIWLNSWLPFCIAHRNAYAMCMGRCRETSGRLLLQSAVTSQALKYADWVLQCFN